MNCSPIIRTIVATFATAVMLVGNVFAHSYERAREIAAHAESLYAAGDSEEARKVLVDGVRQCGNGDDDGLLTAEEVAHNVENSYRPKDIYLANP